MTEQIASFLNAFKSIFIGMGVTLKYLTRRSITLQYPFEKRTLPERFRGPLKLKGVMGEDELEFIRTDIQEHNSLITEKDAQLRLPPCNGTCPANVDARGQNALVAEGKYLEALELIRHRNVFPRTLGRICHHPCEERCRRAYYDEPISIRALHRVVGDWAVNTNNNHVEKIVPTSDKKIAIIGCGPAGLAAAFDLVRKGYQVTVFEKHQEAGGMLRFGVPRYRLPDDVLATDVGYIQSLGVEIKTGVEIGKDITFSGLRAQGFEAILIAVGLRLSRSLPIPGVDLPGVLLAVPFLYAANTTEKADIGKRVIVIGGGNVAVDVARCAKRMGAEEVNMACLESRVEMPAFSWEIEEALDEGIKIHCSWGPNRIVEKKGKVAGLELKECTCVFDESGRFNPQFDECKLNVIEGDTVIISIGQMSDLSFLKDSGVEVDERGRLTFDRETLATSSQGVFACGEVVTGPGSAIGSISTGHEAAVSIDRYLNGRDLKEERTPPFIPNYEKFTPLKNLEQIIEPERKRKVMPMLPAEERVHHFEQIELGFSENMGLEEAYRCLRCHSLTCVGCGFCARTCPDYAINVDRSEIGSEKREVHTYELDLTKCVFCGMCALQCPTDALTMGNEYELATYEKSNLNPDKEWIRHRAHNKDNKKFSKTVDDDGNDY